MIYGSNRIICKFMRVNHNLSVADQWLLYDNICHNSVLLVTTRNYEFYIGESSTTTIHMPLPSTTKCAQNELTI